MNLNNDFTCNRLVNHASMTIPTDRWVHATGTGYANAVENNSNFTMYPRAHVDVGTSKFVNNGAMYAGGPTTDYAHIAGNLENNDYLLPSASHLPAGGFLYVDGDFTCGTGAQLRLRLRGTATTEYDHMTISGAATLAGLLDVRLTDGFVPSIGNTFYLMNPRIPHGPVQLGLSADAASRPDLGAHLLRDVCDAQRRCGPGMVPRRHGLLGRRADVPRHLVLRRGTQRRGQLGCVLSGQTRRRQPALLLADGRLQHAAEWCGLPRHRPVHQQHRGRIASRTSDPSFSSTRGLGIETARGIRQAGEQTRRPASLLLLQAQMTAGGAILRAINKKTPDSLVAPADLTRLENLGNSREGLAESCTSDHVSQPSPMKRRKR